MFDYKQKGDIMESIHIVMAMIVGMGGLMLFLFEGINRRIDKLDCKIDKLDVKVSEIDKRVFAIETMLHMKDCCMLKDHRHIEKAL